MIILKSLKDICNIICDLQTNVMSEAGWDLNPDVLEKIFSYLSFRDLMAVELVCKSWKEVIDNR